MSLDLNLNSQQVKNLYYYFGITLGGAKFKEPSAEYHDIEKFILDNTVLEHSSRTLEGFLTWLKKYGFILSPSKLRRMVNSKYKCDKVVLGAFMDFVQIYSDQDMTLVTKLCKKNKNQISLLKDVPLSLIRSRNKIFERWGVIIPDYKLDEGKFLLSNEQIINHCPELRNRVFMGSVLHADLYTYLSKNGKHETKYRIAKNIFNLSGSVGKAPLFKLNIPDQIITFKPIY